MIIDWIVRCWHVFFARVDELYRFLNSWVAHIYGDLDEEALKLRGFELIQHDTEWANNRASSKVSYLFATMTAESPWPMISGRWRHWWWDWRVHERILGGELIKHDFIFVKELFVSPKAGDDNKSDLNGKTFSKRNSFSLFSFCFVRNSPCGCKLIIPFRILLISC